MKKSDQLKQERSLKQDAQNAIVTKVRTEKRDWTPEEEKQFDDLDSEIEVLDKSIERELKAEKLELDLAKRTANPITGNKDDGEGGEAKEKREIAKRFSFSKALRQANPINGQPLDGAEKEMHEIGLAENRAAKVDTPDDTTLSIPFSLLRASQQTVSQDGGAFGGALVQDQAPRIVDPLRPRLWLEDLGATFLTGLTGGNLPLIVDADFVMEWLAEGATLTVQKKEYAGPSLNPKRAGGAVDISNRLLMQSSPDVEAMIMNGLRNGFLNLLNGAAINGAGGVAPTGLLSYVGVQASSQVAAGAATWARIVELQGLIESENATEGSLGYLMHPKLKAALKQITKDAGSGQFLLAGKEVDGYKYKATTLMPKLTGDTLFPLIYGDFKQMFIGQWGSVNIKVNPYSADLADSVRLTLNTHADMQIANPKAFAKNAFLTA